MRLGTDPFHQGAVNRDLPIPGSPDSSTTCPSPERAARFVRDDTAKAKLDKLDALLAQSFTPRQDATLLAEMLSLPNDGRYPVLELLPQQRRQRTLEALTAQSEALSRQRPVLMIFEDAHWIDPTSLEALGRAVDRIRSLGVDPRPPRRTSDRPK